MKKLLIILTLINSCLFAVVPIINAPDVAFKLKYTGKALSYINWIASTASSVQQIQALSGLKQIEKGGKAICDLCSPQEMQDLQVTLQGITGGLCEAFSQTMSRITNVKQQYDTISDIQNALATNPAEAALILQQASLQSQMQTQQILQEMQAEQAMQSRKQLVEDKIQRQAATDFWGGSGGGK